MRATVVGVPLTRLGRVRRHAWAFGVAAVVALGLGLILVVYVVDGGLDGGPAGETSPGRTASVPRVPASALYWGAWIGDQFTGTEAPFDMAAVSRFQRLAGGKGLSLIEFSSPFENCHESPCVPYAFPRQAFQSVRRYGAIPLFDWGSNALPIRPTAARFALRTIIAGDHDAYIRSWARSAARWGHPFFLRFDWEMNGRWFPWGWGANGNRAGEFILAWRHIHTIFSSVGATNATWVWCPNVDPARVFGPLEAMYPGAGYVDWTCLDVYNRNAPWASFDELFRSTYGEIEKLAPGKPMLIAEVGSTERGGSKAAWITALLGNLSRRYPLVRGLAWFEKYGSGFDWPIETSKASTRAFARAISSSLYVRNAFAALADGRIHPPR